MKVSKRLKRFNDDLWSNLPAIGRRPWVRVLLGIYVATMIGLAIPKAQKMSQRSDHYVIWNAGKNFYEHKNLYGSSNAVRPFTYTPFAAFLFQPLHMIPFRISVLVLYLMNALILLPLTVILLYRILFNMGVSPERARMVLAISLLFSLKYIWNNLIMVQVNQVLFFFMVAGIYLLTRKKPHLAGLLFTLITCIKIIPVFLAAYVFLYHFSRKVATTMILTAMICLLLPAALRGPSRLVQDYASYYNEFLKEYVVEGRIVADRVNHSLKAGLIKSIHPESRGNEHIYPEDYPRSLRLISIIQYALIATLIFNGIVLFRRKVPLSLAYLASIILFAHLYSGITWTAHLVTLTFCFLPFLLIEVSRLRPFPRAAYFFSCFLLVFLGMEGRDLVGEKIYLFIRYNDVFTLMLLALFLFYSWVVWSPKAKTLYPESILI